MAKAGRAKITFWLEEDLAKEVRDIVFWTNNLTVSSFMEQAARDMAEHYRGQEVNLLDPETNEVFRKRAGEPYPDKAGDIKTGRPPKED